jgi:superfamily II DNA or RNA helicase
LRHIELGSAAAIVLGATGTTVTARTAPSATELPDVPLVQQPATVATAQEALAANGTTHLRLAAAHYQATYRAAVQYGMITTAAAAAAQVTAAARDYKCRRILVFCANNAAAQAVCDCICTSARDGESSSAAAVCLDATDNSTTRASVLSRLNALGAGSEAVLCVVTSQLFRESLSVNSVDMVVCVGEPALLRTLMQMAGRCMRPLEGKHAYWLHLRVHDKGACLSYAEGLRGVLQNYNLQTQVWESAPLRRGDNRAAAIENEYASPLAQQMLLDELDATAAELSTLT